MNTEMFASTIALFNIFYTLTPLKESVVLVCLAYLAVKHSFSLPNAPFLKGTTIRSGSVSERKEQRGAQTGQSTSCAE
jgi:hypothetical protein